MDMQQAEITKGKYYAFPGCSARIRTIWINVCCCDACTVCTVFPGLWVHLGSDSINGLQKTLYLFGAGQLVE